MMWYNNSVLGARRLVARCLNLRSRGIPHLFIVNADGTLMEEGHPAKLLCEEKLNGRSSRDFRIIEL